MAGEAKSRQIDLNDPALKDLARRQQKQILSNVTSNASDILSKETESKPRPRVGDHKIFEGLDNKHLLDHQTLKMATHKDIFGAC